MKLLVDAQCVQSSSSTRGIGRYALSLVRGLVQEAGGSHVEVLLNGGDDAARLLRARAALETFLPPGSVHVFEAPWPWTAPTDPRRREVADAAYTAAVRSIGPDAVLVASPFEGDQENVLAVRPTPHDPPTAAVLYDLIPAMEPSTYLLGPVADGYWRRLDDVRRCDALLAISRHSGWQAEHLLGDTCPPVTPVWGGPYPSGDFPAFESQTDDRPGIELPQRFVLSVGGDHPRKNLDRLVEAWGRVPRPLRRASPLVLACRLNPGTMRRLRRIARAAGVGQEELVLTGGVSEGKLHELYTRALLFVFPSVEEGLGMPPLEAMAAGCPVLLASGSSLSELSADPAVFFDGTDVADLARAVTRALEDDGERDRLRTAAQDGAARFTWSASARLAWQALARLPAAASAPARAPEQPVPLSDGDALARLIAQPAPVRLDAPLPEGPPGALGLPIDARAVLAPATALLAADLPRARAAVRAGLLGVPVLVGDHALARAAEHDFHAAYADALRALAPLNPPLAEAAVAAAVRAPRWTLERPAPAWLLLTNHRADDALVQQVAKFGVDLVVARTEAGALAVAADVVLIAAADLPAVEHSLAHARRRGTVVVALHLEGSTHQATPAWCVDRTLRDDPLDPASWTTLLEAADTWGRTTGWPWRAR